MKKIVNILHISDFHQSQKTALSEKHVLQPFFSDLDAVVDSEIAPDLVLFTGDLVFSADEEGTRAGYDRLRSDVLDPLSKTTGLPPNKIVLCPGNHDASRKAIDQQRSLLAQLRTTGLTGSDPAEEAYCKAVFGKFLNFAANYYSRPELAHQPFFHEHRFPDLDLVVGALNSGALTSAGLPGLDEDSGQLRVREIDVARLSLVEDVRSRVLIQHHPTEWLHPASRLAYEAAALRNVALHCYGHMHDAKPRSVFYGDRRLSSNQSGALFYGSHRSDTYKGYAVIAIDVETAQAKIIHRRYYNARARFDASLEDFSEGVFYSDERAEKHFRFHQPKYSRKKLDDWAASTLLHHYQEPWIASDGIKPKDKFFDPDLELRDPVAEVRVNEEDSPKPPVESLSTLRARSDNVLLEGAAESGKSESLRQWTLRGLESAGGSTRIPIYVDWKTVNPRNHSIESVARRSVASLPEGFEVVDLLRRGVLEVLIDNFVINADSVQWLDDAIKSSPKCRFVLASTEDLRNPLDFGTISPAGSPFIRARLRQLRPAQIRKYVKSALPLAPSVEDRFMADIHREVTQNNLPLTPFTIWSIIEVYQRDKSIRFANKANFVERLIEIKLEKYSAREIDASTFDFENKSHCLTELAAWMVGRDQYRPTCADVEHWISAYVNNLGLSLRPLKLLKMFEESGILVRDGDHLTFSFRIFLEYFIACKMAQDRSFLAAIATKENFLAFHNEVVLYFAKSRQDRELLDWVAGVLDGMAASLEARGALDPNFEASLDGMPIAGGREEKQEFESFSAHMSLPQPSDDERDEVLEAQFPEDIGKRQEVYRPKLESEEARWIYSFILYSQMIRFADFLTDQEKQIHVARALRHWARFTHISLRLIPALIETGKMVVDGVSYDIRGLLELPRAERLRVLQILLPFGLSRLVSYYMNSDKLRRQIKHSDETESAFVAMLRGGLLLDLGYEGVADDLERFLKLTDRSRWARSVLLRRAVETYSRSRLPDGDVFKFRKVVADGVARHRGVTGRTVPDRVNKISSAMKRQRLQILISRDEVVSSSPQAGVSDPNKKKTRKPRRKK